MTTRSLAVLLTILAGASASCGDFATSEYLGEPLLQLRGQVRSSLKSWPSSLKLGFVYAGPQTEEGRILRHVPIEVKGDFPARFTVTLREPPPDEVAEDGFVFGLLVATENRLNDRTVRPEESTEALAEAAGWSAVAPAQVVYVEERSLAIARGQGFPAQPGFNVFMRDIDADFAVLAYQQCFSLAVSDPNSSYATCVSICDEETVPSNGEERSCPEECLASSCGDPVGYRGPRLAAPDEELTFDLDRDLLALLRAQTAASSANAE